MIYLHTIFGQLLVRFVTRHQKDRSRVGPLESGAMMHCFVLACLSPQCKQLLVPGAVTPGGVAIVEQQATIFKVRRKAVVPCLVKIAESLQDYLDLACSILFLQHLVHQS
jgi:hypothetical protein